LVVVVDGVFHFLLSVGKKNPSTLLFGSVEVKFLFSVQKYKNTKIGVDALAPSAGGRASLMMVSFKSIRAGIYAFISIRGRIKLKKFYTQIFIFQMGGDE
jgi:hypothetical protein